MKHEAPHYEERVGKEDLTDYFLTELVRDVPRVVLVVPVRRVGIEVEALGGVLRAVVDAANQVSAVCYEMRRHNTHHPANSQCCPLRPAWMLSFLVLLAHHYLDLSTENLLSLSLTVVALPLPIVPLLRVVTARALAVPPLLVLALLGVDVLVPNVSRARFEPRPVGRLGT